MTTRFIRTTRGFTLIELLVVIVIIGILAAALIPKIAGGPAKARDTARVADLRSLAIALENYKDDHGVYPGTSGTQECLYDGTTFSASGALLTAGGYMSTTSFPKDPSVTNVIPSLGSAACTGSYSYKPLISNGISANGYMIAARTENINAANAIVGGCSAATDVAAVDVATCVEGVGKSTATAANAIYVMFGGR